MGLDFSVVPKFLDIILLGALWTVAITAGAGPSNAVAKDIRLAEMMIARGTKPDPAALADPSTNLKALLKG